jgi:hypothetical protein
MLGQPSTPPRRGLDPILLAVGVLAVVVALVGLALFTGVLRFGSADGSPPASASAVAASGSVAPSATAEAPTGSELPSAGPGGIVVGGLVEATAGGLPVMESAGLGGTLVGTLPAGQAVFVAEGPVEQDGLTWFLLSGLGLPPNSGCEAPTTIADCPSWIGWAASASGGDAALQPVEASCADLGDYRAFARLQPLVQLVCAGDDPVTLTAWWPGPSPDNVCIDAPPGVDWLYCALAFGGWLAPSPDEVGTQFLAVAVDPSSGVTLPEPGRWVEVTGHLNDPASDACNVVPGNPTSERAAWAQVLQCRSTLVVDSMVEVAGG